MQSSYQPYPMSYSKPSTTQSIRKQRLKRGESANARRQPKNLVSSRKPVKKEENGLINRCFMPSMIQDFIYDIIVLHK